MNKSIFLILGIMILFSLNFISAYSNSTFNNSLVSENLTFSSSSNITRYLSVPQNTYLTNGFLNLTGYNTTGYGLSNNSDNVGEQSGVGSESCTNMTVAQTGLQQVNMQSSGIDSSWGIQYINVRNSSGLLESHLMTVSPWSINTTSILNQGSVYSFCVNNTVGVGKWRYESIYPGIGTYKPYVSISALTNTYPSNPSIFIGNNKVWNYSGTFNSTNATSNLANSINSYLSSCTYSSGYCQVPFVFHSDSAGILEYFNMSFNNSGFIENDVDYSTSVYETSNQDFSLNLTFGESNPLHVSGVLNYNGTNYTSEVNCTLGNCIVNNNLDIPVVNTTQNKSFYWIIDYFYDTNEFTISSDSYNQTVNSINITNCTSGTVALNFTAMDETSLVSVSPFRFIGSFNYWLGSGDTYKTLNVDINSSSMAFCLSKNDTFYTTASVEYSATNYVTRYYYLTNATLTNSTNNIILYLLGSSDSTSFIDEVLETDRTPVEDAYIYIQRCYPGSCITVQVLKTDATGRSIGFYKAETVDYKHIIMKDGIVIYEDNPHKIFGTTTPFTNTFYIQDLIPIIFNQTISNLYYSLTYDNSTGLVTYTYIDSSGLFTNARLLVELTNYSGNNGVVCNTVSNQSSASITCNMSGQPEENYEATAYITRSSEEFVDSLNFNLNNVIQMMGYEGLFLGFLIILTASMAFLYHPIAGTWLTIGAMIFTNVIGFTAFSSVWIGGAIVLGLIFTWFFRE